VRVAGLVVLSFVVCFGCDLQPPKHKAAAVSDVSAGRAAPTPTPQPPNRPQPNQPPPSRPQPAAGSGSAAPATPPAAKTTEECTKVGAHVAEIVIASIEDPTIRAQQEQDRTRLVRRIAETCTRDQWSPAAQKCFLDGKTAPDLEVCGRALAPAKK